MAETRQPSQPPRDTRRCPHCRALNPADADWCSQCLERFKASPVPPSPPPGEFPAWKKPKVGELLAAIAATMLIIGGLTVAGFFLLLSLLMSMDSGGFGSNK